MRGNLLTFSDKYILVETSFIEAHPNFKELVFKLQIEGYKVILAHPERYPFMSMQDYEELADKFCCFYNSTYFHYWVIMD